MFPSLLNRNANRVSQGWALGSARAVRLGATVVPGMSASVKSEWNRTNTSAKQNLKVDLEVVAAFCCSAGFPGGGECWI